MASVNKVILLGNLGRDPETRYMPDGGAISTISMATTETWKDKQGEKQEKTEWHRVVFFGKLAEVVGEYLKKGSQCYVEGKLTTRNYEKDGEKKYVTEVVAHSLVMCGGRNGGGGDRDGDRGADSAPQRRENPPTPKPEAGKPRGKFDDFEDDIPF